MVTRLVVRGSQVTTRQAGRRRRRMVAEYLQCNWGECRREEHDQEGGDMILSRIMLVIGDLPLDLSL